MSRVEVGEQRLDILELQKFARLYGKKLKLFHKINMKKFKKYSGIAVLLLTIVASFVFTVPTLTVLADNTLPPKIISISPTAVNRDNIVEVIGENFGGVYTGEVVINGSRITDVEDWSDTKIRVAARGFTGTGDLPLFIRANQGGDGNLVDSNTISLRVLQKVRKYFLSLQIR